MSPDDFTTDSRQSAPEAAVRDREPAPDVSNRRLNVTVKSFLIFVRAERDPGQNRPRERVALCETGHPHHTGPPAPAGGSDRYAAINRKTETEFWV